MADHLVIRLGNNPEQAAHWIAVDDSGSRRSPPTTGPLAEATNDIGDRSVIVLVPASSVLTTTVNLPIKSRARLRSALPFALEEQLAEDVENLHFAPGERDDEGNLHVAVVAHAQMQEWLEILREAGIKPDRLIPENHGLAKIPGTMSMLVAEDQVMFNDGATNEFAIQDVQPSDVLAVSGALDDADSGNARHLLVYCEPGDETRFRDDWNVLREQLDSVDINLLSDGVLPRLAVTVGAKRGINLLQGEYGSKVEYGPLLRPWRTAALLLVGLFVVGFATKLVDYYRLSAEQDALREQFTRTYREIRPGDTSEITNPAGYVDALRRNLGAPIASGVFLPSLQQLSEALQQNEAAEIEAISYRAGIVDIRLTAPDVATLDSIQKLVSTSGRFTASIQSTDQVGDKVSSRIQIRESGA